MISLPGILFLLSITGLGISSWRHERQRRLEENLKAMAEEPDTRFDLELPQSQNALALYVVTSQPFRRRFWVLVSNPFLYLFKGEWRL